MGYTPQEWNGNGGGHDRMTELLVGLPPRGVHFEGFVDDADTSFKQQNVKTLQESLSITALFGATCTNL